MATWFIVYNFLGFRFYICLMQQGGGLEGSKNIAEEILKTASKVVTPEQWTPFRQSCDPWTPFRLCCDPWSLNTLQTILWPLGPEHPSDYVVTSEYLSDKVRDLDSGYWWAERGVLSRQKCSSALYIICRGNTADS